MNNFDGRVWSAPHFLKIVKGPDFRFKKMNDDVACIDNNPVAILLALHPDILEAQEIQSLRKLHGEGANVAGGCAGRNDHEIGEG